MPVAMLALKLSRQRMESLPSKELTVDLEGGNGVVCNQYMLILQLTKGFSHHFIHLGVILQEFGKHCLGKQQWFSGGLVALLLSFPWTVECVCLFN